MASTGRSSRAVGRPRREPAPDALAAASEVWTAVVDGLQSARYAEAGAEYAKLSALLIQQRTAQALTGAPVDERWAELSRTAQRALDLLEPLLGAARLLATVPVAPAPAPSRSRRRPPAGPSVPAQRTATTRS